MKNNDGCGSVFIQIICKERMAIVSDKKYYVIEESALPEVILKVIEVKNMLNRGEVKYVSEAVELVGISRSAYYKYQGVVHPFLIMKTHDIFH